MAHNPRKKAYFARLQGYLEEFKKVLLVKVDNVGAAQLQNARKELRGTAKILMGKNTMIRKCIRGVVEAGNTELDALLQKIQGNVGLVFTNGDLAEIRTLLVSSRVPAPAKAGVVAPLDVVIPAGPTGLEPTATSFLQALNIPSKIVRGQVELTGEVHLIHAGEKVKPGEAALLQKLKITPFTYGMDVVTVYDSGFVYDAKLLDITDREVLASFSKGITRIAALGLSIGFPCIATVPHSIAKSFQNLLAVSIETNYTFKEAEKVKDMLANPDAYKTQVEAPVEEKAAEPEPEPEPEESSEEMDLDLFG